MKPLKLTIRIYTITFALAVVLCLAGAKQCVAAFGSIKSQALSAGVTFDSSGAIVPQDTVVQPQGSGGDTQKGYPVISVSGLPDGNMIINDIVLEIELSDDTELVRASLVCRNSDRTEIKSYNIDSLGGVKSYTWNVTIPHEMLEGLYLDFYLEAEDVDNNISYWGSEEGGTVTQLEYNPIRVSRTLSRTARAIGGNVVFEDTNPQDGEISMDFPVVALNADQSVSLKILRMPAESAIYGRSPLGHNPVMVYELMPGNIVLNKPVSLTLLYYDSEDMQGAPGAPGLVDGTAIRESDLAIYWWDGFEWRPVGGVVDTESNTINTNISRFGIYGIFPAMPASAATYRPAERIITPNGDGYNDFAQFNALGNESVEIKVFDVTGRKIRTINGQPHVWDGRDDDGRKVENGVYIYQFKVGGKQVNGVIAVAK